MAKAVYILCAFASLACAVLLLRSWRATQVRLLLWSGLCFALLSVSNALIAIDLIMLPELDLFGLRNLTGLAGVSLMLYGLIQEAE